MKLVIPGEFTDTNTYVKAAKSHHQAAGKIAAAERQRAYIAALEQKLPPAEDIPLYFHFRWYCSHKRKDPGNLRFAEKWIMDGLQDAKVIQNDGWGQVAGYSDQFFIDKDNPRVEIVIHGSPMLPD